MGATAGGRDWTAAISDLDIDALDAPLAADVRSSLERGVEAGVVYEVCGDPDCQFRAAVKRAVTAIAARDERGLLLRFLTKGPYTSAGRIKAKEKRALLSDDEVAAAIRLIHSSAINSFQGALAELLAVGAVCEVVERAFGKGGPRVFAGDAILARKPRRSEWAKSADLHVIEMEDDGSRVAVLGVAEVKSYVTTPERLRNQLAQHLRRPRRGLLVQGRHVAAERVRVGAPGAPATRICVVPSSWKLSRAVQFRSDGTHDIDTADHDAS